MKKKVFFLLFFLGIVSFSANLFAFEIGSQEVEITLTESYVSRYIWRGQDLYPTDDGAHQPSIDIAFPGLLQGTDVSLNLWGSFPLVGGHEDSEELNYTLTFSRDVSELFNLSLGYTYFDFPNTGKTADVSEPWGSVTLNKIPVLPIDLSMTVFAGYDFQVAAGGPEEGWYYSWGFDTELSLPQAPFLQEDQTLALGIVNWGNDGVAGLKKSSLYATELSFSTSYAFKGFSITPNLHYTINHENSINADDDEVWGGIEISHTL